MALCLYQSKKSLRHVRRRRDFIDYNCTTPLTNWVGWFIERIVKEDAEESGQRLGKGWEARVRSCVESDVSVPTFVRCSRLSGVDFVYHGRFAMGISYGDLGTVLVSLRERGIRMWFALLSLSARSLLFIYLSSS